MKKMSVKEKAIIKTFIKYIPTLSELEKEKFLWFIEGIAFKADQIEKEKQLHK